MSQHNIIDVGLTADGHTTGTKTITKNHLDIMESANKAHAALSALEGRFGGIGTSSASGFGAAKEALKSVESPLTNFKNMLEQVESRIVRIGATVLTFRAIGAVISTVTSLFKEGIKSVEDYQNTIIAISASLTQVAILQEKLVPTGKSIPQMYAESAKYAEILAEKMREVDVNSYANYDQIMQMLGVYTSTGNVLDVNNKRQIEGWTALTNAIPIMTKGQDITRQMNTEMRALATGSTVAGATIARAVDSMLKADKLANYQNGLKDVVAQAKETGVSVLELLAPYLKGFTAALPQIQLTLTNAKTSLQTAVGIAQRQILKPVVNDIIAIIQGGIIQIGEGTNSIGELVQNSWNKVKNSIFEVKTIIDSTTNGTKDILVVKPEILEGLKKVGNTFSWIGSIVRDATLFLIKHAESINLVALAYLARKGVMAVAFVAMQLANESQRRQNEEELKAIAVKAKLAAAEEALAAARARSLAMSDGSLIRTAPGVIKTETNLYDVQQTNLKAIANNELAASEARVAATTVANTQAQMMNAVATRDTLIAEVAKQQSLVSRIALEVKVAETTLAMAEIKLADANALKASTYANTQAMIVEKERMISSEHSLARQAVLKAELAALNNSLLNMDRMLLNSQNMVNTTKAQYNAIVADSVVANNSLAFSQKSLAMAEEFAAKASGSNAIAKAAEATANAKLAITETALNGSKQALIAANFKYLASVEAEILANQVATTSVAKFSLSVWAAAAATDALAIAKTALTGALNLMGGAFGAILIGLYLGYEAWEKWGNAAEKARKKAYGKSDDFDNLISTLAEEQRRYIAEQKMLDDLKKGNIPEKQDVIAASSDYKALQEQKDTLSDLTKEYWRLGAAAENLKKAGNVRTGLFSGESSSEAALGKQVELLAKINRIKTQIVIAEDLIAKKQEHQIQAPIQPKIKSEEDTLAVYNESVSAFNDLRKEWTKWDIQAIKSGKVQDELGAKIEEITYRYKELGEKQALASKIDKTGTDQMMAHITIAKELMIVNETERANKKAQDELDRANASASISNYRSQLSERKSLLSEQLSDMLIARNQYNEKLKVVVNEEGKIAIKEAQDAYDKAKGEQDKIGTVSSPLKDQVSWSEYIKYVVKTTEAKKTLDKVTSDVGKNNHDVTRNTLKDLEAEKSAYIELINKVQQLKSAQTGVDPSTGIVVDSKSNQIANVKSSYFAQQDVVMRQINDIDKLEVKDADSIAIRSLLYKEYYANQLKYTQDIEKANSSAYYGMKEAVSKYNNETQDVGKQVETMWSNLAKSMEDSITTAFDKGELSVKSFFALIRTEVIRMTVAKPITNMMSSAMGNLIAMGSSASSSGNPDTSASGVVNAGAGVGAWASKGASSYVMPMIGVAVGITAIASAIMNSDDKRQKEHEEAIKMQKTINQSILIGKQNLTGEVNLAQVNELMAKQEQERKNTMDTLITSLSDVIYMKGTVTPTYVSDKQKYEAISTGGSNSLDSMSNSQFTSANTTWKNLIELQALQLKDLKDQQEYKKNNLLLNQMDLQGLKGTTEYLKILSSVRDAEINKLDKVADAYGNSEQSIQRTINALQDEKDVRDKVTKETTKSIDAAISAAQAVKDIQSGSLNTDTAKQKYDAAVRAYETNTDKSKSGSLGKDLLSLSQQVFGSTGKYQTDYQRVITDLNGIGGITTTAEKQLTVLEQIKEILSNGTAAQIDAVNSAVTSGMGNSGAASLITNYTKLATDEKNNRIKWQNNVSGIVGWLKPGVLPTFANGGITNGLSIAGEGRYNEAVIPLPDGRSVPVQMTGSADNKGVEDRLDRLIAANEAIEKRMATIEQNVRTNR